METKTEKPIDYRKSSDELARAFFAWKKANPGEKVSAVSFAAGWNAAKKVVKG